MRRLQTTWCMLGLAVLLGATGCGSSGYDGQGTDALTLSFTGFTGDGIDQEDAVFNTSADVDVCATICEISGFFDITFERFTQTHANALFVNQGTSPILLDRYTVSVPGSGLPDRTTQIASLLPGGVCSASTQPCGVDSDCPGGDTCEHEETAVEVLLYDFQTKDLLRDGTCPELDPITLLVTPGTVTPQTYQTFVTFSGSDQSGERFTVRSGLTAGFFDANNCEE